MREREMRREVILEYRHCGRELTQVSIITWGVSGDRKDVKKWQWKWN